MDHNDQAYAAPSIDEIGSVHELTLDTDKDYAPKSDGYTFHHLPINVS